jgi:N-acetylmuramoyl-L-alanine amidase
MSKIVENFLVPLFLVISVFYAFHSFAEERVVLNKVYHHTTNNDAYLEKANISLYFSGNPQIQTIKNKSLSFFFPEATISQGECEAMINKLNNYHGGYKVAVTHVMRPSKGLMIQFEFDPNQYMVNYEQFDSIGLQKGFAFRLYNKELLTKLERANNQPVLRTLCNEKPRIVIDSGHGGHDTGAIGHNGIQEKQVCLAIGKTVGSLLQEKGCAVLLTRNNDCDMQLDERTSYANDNNADLFVSIHANYASSQKAVGVETFCIQPRLLKKNHSLLSSEQDCCVTNIMAQRTAFSQKLAQSVQSSVCKNILDFHKESIDRKVKHSVSQVLLGVQAPSILIEVGFLSHPYEARLLNDSQYQRCIARGISDGILSALSF